MAISTQKQDSASLYGKVRAVVIKFNGSLRPQIYWPGHRKIKVIANSEEADKNQT